METQAREVVKTSPRNAKKPNSSVLSSTGCVLVLFVLGGVLLGALGESSDKVLEVLEQFRRQSYSRLTEIRPLIGSTLSR